MNEEALRTLYSLAQNDGYTKNFEDFKVLMSSNEEAVDNMYRIAQDDGYTKNTQDFYTLVGFKKKSEDPYVSPMDIMDSTSKEREQNFSLELLKKDEDEAKPLLQDKLTGKGYSIEQTGIGDALNVTDNITGEVTEIDLQPFTDSGTSEELSKINKLLNTATDSKRKLLSTNSKEDFDNNVDDYIERLRSKYSNFAIDQIDEENVRISKGDQSQVFKVKDVRINNRTGASIGFTPNEEAYKEINSFIYQNLDDKEAAEMNSRLGLDTLKSLEEGLKNIESTVDVSVEAAEAEVYNKDYFKGLFDFLESNGVAIPEEAKNNLSRGTKLETVTIRNRKTSREKPLSKEEIQQNIQNYFGENLDMINAYDVSKIVSVRKQKIDRAKKLKTEIFYDSLPNKEEVKEVLRQSRKNITEEELDITANVKLAENDIKKMYNGLSNDIQNIKKNNPNAKFTPLYDDNGMLIDITSDTPIKELDELNKRVRESFKNYSDLYEVSKYKLEKLAAKKGTTDEFMDASNRNYDLIDNAMADLKNAALQLGGGIAIIKTLAEGVIEDVVGVPVSFGSIAPPMSADLKMKLIRGDMKESREKIENFFETRRTYDEAFKEGSLLRFSTLTFAQQAPNIALAIGTSGAGTALGLGKVGTQLLVGTQFGLTSAGQKYDELTTRQEFGNIAKKGLKELEELKGIIPDKEYLTQKYELERALKDSEISSADKTLSVIGTGIVEGAITSFLGTAPNSIKVLKDLKNVKSVDFIKDILKSNYKAAGSALKELGKRTGGEVLEEGSIDALTQVNDYLFLGDQIDLSTLDDTAVTSIITSGAMNTPSIAYSTILKQVNVNRYKNAIQGKTNQIQSLKDMLNDTDMSDLQRASIHNSINSVISSIADETTAMEGDALLMGADSIKEMLTLNGVKDNMLKKAEVESDDSYEIARTKIDNYLSTLSEGDAKKFIDQMKYIDDTRNKLLGKIKYEGAVAKVFGEKGKQIASKLDPTLTPKQKYVEVYKQIRQEINENALKEFIALQDQKESKADAKKEASITPETSSNYANLTEDDEGNFVFYHVGSEGYSQVKPRSGATKATSGEERAALSKVGGMAMYYTKASDGESMVSGSTKYEVKVPKDKVYDFNSDPLNLKKEAKERHDAENPGKGYDNNSELAYVAKIAEEKGFDMVVAEWDGKTRAQTTKALAPNDTQVKEGNTVVKPFNNQYESNADKGFVSVIPESKQSKLSKLYNKIYKERNKQNKYDDLYRLQENSVKMSQEEITDLIEGSDLSQEIKDEYKEILESKEGKRKSVNKKDTKQEEGVASEPADMPNAPKGVFLDIEMIAGKDGRKMSEGEIIDALPFNEVEVDNDGTNLRVKIPRKLSNSEMMTLMKATQQEAIGQVVDGKGVLHAQSKKLLADYGNMFNPEYFKLPRELRKVTTEVTEGVSKLREMFSKTPDQRKQVDNALNALSKIAPEVNIVVHESEQAYAEATGETGRKQKTSGTYDETIVDGKVKKVIHINPDKANARTVAHEAFHAIFLNIVKNDAEAQRLSAAMIKAVYKSAPAELKKLIDNFAESKNADGSNNYDSAVQNEEKLAELIGYLATEYGSLSKPTKNVIKRFLDRLAKMFGMKPFTDSEVIDVLNTIAGKVARGEVISDKDISIINKREISNRTEGMSRNQLQDLFLSDDKVKLKSTKDVAKYLDAWTKESAVFEDDVKNISDREIVDRFVDHLTLELHAWEKVRKDDYISFYDDDVVKNTNPTLQQYAKNEYGRELTDTEVKLYHLVSSFASPSANPEMDSWKGFDIFDRWMKTGELSGYSDKIATVWKTLPGGKRVDTGVPRLDDKGKTVRSKVTPAYSQTGLDKFNILIENMGGDIDKAMEWITSQHSYSEISDMFGYPEKGPKSMKQNEYMTKDSGGLGVFGMTGAKLGSYILNRFGNFSTVTKDMWYARTMARLSGQDLISVNKKTGKEGAIKTPWSESTKEGRRMRSLADEAFKKVADLFDTSPAMVQERIWDFEKRLYEMLGANEDAAYTSDGLKKGIDRAKGSTTPRKEPITRSRKQIIGENADLTALNLSYSLNLAKEIESSKTAEELRLITGWERGKDNKWRYELPDGKLTLRESGTFKLSDIYYSKDLYKTYPQLKDMKVEVDIRQQGAVNAWFLPKEKSIEINAKPDSDVTSLLIHEIQHAIQFIEGFAIGGNMVTAFEAYENTVTPEEKIKELELKGEVEVLRNLSDVLETATIDFEDMSLDEVLDLDFMKENLDVLGLEEVGDAVNIYEYINIDNPQIINKLKKDKFGDSLDLEESFEEASFMADEKQAEYSDKYSTYALYQRLAGEVESRNVEKRYRMSEEKRRKTLLEATENVAREDQILLFPEEPITRSRKQVPGNNANDIVRYAKENNISDADIRAFGKEMGIPVSSLNKAIVSYDTEKRVAGQKSEKMFISKGVVDKFFDKLNRHLTSSRGFMPKSMHIAKEVKNGAIEANLKQSRQTLKDLQAFLKKNKKDESTIIENLDKYLRGNEDVTILPEGVQEIAFAMRTHIDSLSKQLIDSGAVSDIKFDQLKPKQKEELINKFGDEVSARNSYMSLQENIMNNIGSYMTRAYEVFDNENYTPSDEVMIAAENKLRQTYRKVAEKIAEKENNSVEEVLDRLVTNKIQDLLNTEGASDFLRGSKEGSKKTGILKERVDIPSEIRALMGEYTDPAVNYARSIQSMAALVENQKFLNKMKEAGERVFFFTQEYLDANPSMKKEFNTKIASEGSETMNPLNGMYTTKEIAEAMLNSPLISITNPVGSKLYEFWLKSVGIVKYNKTILSPATHAKNIVGNLAFMAYNGYVDPKEYFKALDIILTDLRNLPKNEQRSKMQEYIKAGIINQSVNLQEIQAIFDKGGNVEDTLTKRFSDPKNSLVTKAKNGLKKFGRGAEALYQAEDDFFKIVAYENEKSRYAKAFFKKGFNELNESQKKEVTDYVSEIVKNILPNYSRIGNLGKLMKAFPVAGTFISFQLEAMRTAYNTADLARKEIANPKTRAIGIKRLIGIMSVIGLKAAVFGSFGLFGDDEEDEVTKSSRIFLPPWAKNSNVIITNIKDGKFKYINFSASDPHGFMDKALIGLMRGESMGDKVGAVAEELIAPFYSSDLLFNTASNIINNKDNYGRKIWNETDTPNTITEKIAGRLWKTFEPGVVTSAKKVIGTETPVNEIIGQMTGFKEWEVDVNDQLLYKSLDIKKRSTEASKDYSKAYYKFKDKKISKKELEEIYNKSNEKYKEVMTEGLELYTSALKFGIPPKRIKGKMVGFSEKEIKSLAKGIIPDKNKRHETKSAYERMLIRMSK